MARDPTVLQRAFGSLCSHFDCVRLKINISKTEAMVFLPGRIRAYLTVDAYKARMGDLYRKERRVRKVSWQECGQGMVVGSLRSHLETQHGVYTLFVLPADAAPPVAPRHLAAIFDVTEEKYRCPVPGCLQVQEGRGCKTPFNLR